MLRLRQLFRNPSLFFRLDPPFPKHPETANARNVKFKRPWIRNILSTCLLYGAAFHVWSSLVLLQLDDPDDDADSDFQEPTQRGIGFYNGDKGHKNSADLTEESYKEDPVFIPLSWPRSREGKFYASSDPEWQQFVRISNDNEKLQSLRDELAEIALKTVSQSSQVQHVLGGPLSITGYWLIHHFPYKAPPTYERSGLAICDNSISWASRPIPPEDGDRLLRFMQPLSVALAIRDAYLVFVKKQLDRLRGFGSPKAPPSEGNMISGGSALSPEERNADGLSQISQPSTRRPGLSDLQESISEGRENNQSLVISSLQRLPLLELGPGSDLHEASTAFKKRLKLSSSKNARTPRRGTFRIAGPVGIKGRKGFCRVEVRGEYDPAAASWSVISMHLRDINAFQQRAAGDN